MVLMRDFALIDATLLQFLKLLLDAEVIVVCKCILSSLVKHQFACSSNRSFNVLLAELVKSSVRQVSNTFNATY